MTARAVSFAGVSWQTNEIRTTETSIFNPAQRNVAIVKLAQRDGGVYNGGEGDLEPKTFSVGGILRRDSVTDPVAGLDQLLDYFLFIASKPQEIFEIDHANGRRQFIATAAPPIIARDKALASAGFVVNFTAPAGVGHNVDISTLLPQKTSNEAIQTDTITVEGTYKAQPQMRVTFTAVGGGTNKSVMIKNGQTGEGIFITRTWASGDVVDIDNETQELFVNNVPVNFGGVFPEWQPGVGSMVIMDDFTSRTRVSKATYQKRWL